MTHRLSFLLWLPWMGLLACEGEEEKKGGGESEDTGAESALDSDEDGISDEDELVLGTDPENPDSDGDGDTDGEEAESGTNPLDAYSHSYTGGYNVGYCDTPPSPTGPTGTARIQQGGQTYTWTAYQVGDVAKNFTLMDQHGEMVDLYSFCGQTIHIEFGAFW